MIFDGWLKIIILLKITSDQSYEKTDFCQTIIKIQKQLIFRKKHGSKCNQSYKKKKRKNYSNISRHTVMRKN